MRLRWRLWHCAKICADFSAAQRDFGVSRGGFDRGGLVAELLVPRLRARRFSCPSALNCLSFLSHFLRSSASDTSAQDGSRSCFLPVRTKDKPTVDHFYHNATVHEAPDDDAIVA